MSNRRTVLLSTALSAIALLIALGLFIGDPLLYDYTVRQVEQAKWQGKYPSPEAAMQSAISREYRDVSRAEIERHGPAVLDDCGPNVQFVTAKVYAASRIDGKQIAPGSYDLPGAFYLKVDDGWVPVREDQFPQLLGYGVNRFGLYGNDRDSGDCQ